MAILCGNTLSFYFYFTGLGHIFLNTNPTAFYFKLTDFIVDGCELNPLSTKIDFLKVC